MLETSSDQSKNNLPSETIKGLERLSLVLYDIHLQMKADGYEIRDGKVCKIE